jgi:hypothetical protein
MFGTTTSSQTEHLALQCPDICLADELVLTALVHQSPSFEVDHRAVWDLRRRTEMTPVKDSHTRIKPLALASGHGRYTTVAPERNLVSVGEWPLYMTVINL